MSSAQNRLDYQRQRDPFRRSRCFQTIAGSGYKIVIPNQFANELRNLPELSFNDLFAKELFGDYPGLDGVRASFRYETFFQEVVRGKLTQSLGLITDHLVDEASASLSDIWGEPGQWTTVFIKSDIAQLVARLSTRVFLGREFSRNEDWLKISRAYAIDQFVTVNFLTVCPSFFRPVFYWLLPSSARLRKHVANSRKLLSTEVERRVKQAQQDLSDGKKSAKTADAVGWMVEASRGRDVDYVASQLALSTAAIHTTVEIIVRCLLQCCKTPKVVGPLREEIIKILSSNGWSKMSLYNMTMLDSFMKEVQRVHAIATASMHRVVKADITLSDGTKIAAGSRIMVADDRRNDPEVFSEPTKFDFSRFMRMRQSASEKNKHQFATVSSDLMGFGYGEHACPGRYFASNEIKIALCFILLEYEISCIVDSTIPEFFSFEIFTTVNPDLKMQIRKRQPEIDLVDLKVEKSDVTGIDVVDQDQDGR